MDLSDQISHWRLKPAKTSTHKTHQGLKDDSKAQQALMNSEEHTQATERLQSLDAKLTASERLGEGYGERVKAIKAQIDQLQAEVDAYEEENP